MLNDVDAPSGGRHPGHTLNTAPAYRPDIDGLRAIAVMSVVGFHAFPDRVPGGFVGVDIFFVISGYLISSIIFRGVQQGSFSFTNFYLRRIRRIFPALIVLLVVCYGIGWRVLWADEFQQLGWHIAGAVGFVSNFVLWRESGYFDAASDLKPLLHLWSLGIEEQFYLVWPALVFAFSKYRREALIAVGLIGVASFGLNVAGVGAYPVMTFYNPLSRFWELMIGSALAGAHLRGPMKSSATLANVQSVAGLLAIGAALITLNDRVAFPGWLALLPTSGAVLLIAAGPHAWLNRHLLGQRALVFIGLISYPLYLWHWPLLSFLRIASTQPPTWPIRGAVVAASILLAWLTYELVERPVRYGTSRIIAPGLCAGLVMAGIIGVGTAASDGVRWRYEQVENLDRYGLGSPEITRAWRRSSCMLETEGVFGEECIDASPADGPLLVLWGDSHAAALYPGLQAYQGNYDFRIAQFSTSRCPPIIDFVSADPGLHNPQCVPVNRFVLSKIEELRPKAVIMTAYWNIYDPNGLEATLIALTQLGVEHIVVVGDVPIWRAPPSRVVLDAYRQTNSQTLPTRVTSDQFVLPRESDLAVARSARSASAGFVSLLDGLCDSTTCIAMANGYLAYSDRDHLSPPGAELVVGHVFRPFLEQLAAP